MEINNLDTQSNLDIIKLVKRSIKSSSLETRKEHPFNKKYLWVLFKKEFKNLFGKRFLCDPGVAKNIEPIFYYFLESEKFFECPNLRFDISEPSFKKGLLLIGGVGVGKTHIMETFQSLFRKYTPHRFNIMPTFDVVDKYEGINTKDDRIFFYQSLTKGTILFDDLNGERMANNYGRINVMKDILGRRYAANIKTHLTLNYLPGCENDISASLLKLGEVYDQRIIDRMYEMFNIIQFKGLSMRR